MDDRLTGFDILHIYNPLIAQAVQTRELLSSKRIRDIIGEESVERFRNNDKQNAGNNETNVREIFDCIQNNSPENGINELSRTLEDVDFIFLPKLLLKEYERRSVDRIRPLVRAFDDVSVNSKELSLLLRDDDLLTEADVQDIDTECINRNEKAALIILIDRVAVCEEDWGMDRLKSCLQRANLEIVVSRLDDCSMSDELDNDQHEACISPEIQSRKLITEIFKDLILENVTHLDVLGNIGTVLSREEKREIRDFAESNTDKQAMGKLLDMLDKKDSSGKWQSFKDALASADLGWINDVLDGISQNTNESDQWKIMIDLFEGKLTRNILPRELLAWLSQESLISDVDRQAIEQLEENKGRTRAAIKLLQCLPKLQPNDWYPKFMTILVKNNHKELVLEIDSDMYKRLMKTGCIEEDDEDDVSLTYQKTDHDEYVLEANVSVTENPTKSVNNLSSPNNSMEETLHEREEFLKQRLLPKNKAEASGQVETYEKVDNFEQNNIAISYEKKPSKDEKLAQIKKTMALKTSKNPDEIRNNIVETPYDDVSSSDSEDDQTEKKPLKLRKYQSELSAFANDGKRCVIVAPTGSGKTHVIIDIIQHHFSTNLRKNLNSKVVILVEQQALAEQQYNRCKEYLPFSIKLMTGEINREGNTPLSSWFKRKDILVLTAELLVTALRTKDVVIEEITLLVFDECHHANSNHSYNRIMQYYMDKKFDADFDKSQLPQVIGLTASLGVGKSNAMDGAKSHIKTTMAHLDAEKLVTVEENIAELADHVVIPEKGIIKTRQREENHFYGAVSVLMECTEKKMMDSKFAQCLDSKSLKAPTEKGSDVYTQWISKFRRDIAAVRDHEAATFMTTCRNYLEIYNQALIIYEDARVKDARDFLDKNVKELSDVNQDANDKAMVEEYEMAKDLLDDCTDDDNCANPKLTALKDVIFKQCKENRESRIIVFVKTRSLAEALVNFMKETVGLDRLNPTKFVGTQAPGAKGGMTRKDQNELIQLFKDGKHKVILATSVAEEGLDIPTCNLVIRYDHVTNETAMIQARGRGRADDSKFVIIAGEKRGLAEKEFKNEMREDIMNQAIVKIKEDIAQNGDQFLREIEGIQMAEKRRRGQEKMAGPMSDSYQDLEMKCEKCRRFICMTSDIRKIQDAHHAVVNDDVKENIKVVKTIPKRIDELITVNAGKVKCECGKPLGHIIIHRDAQFPVLKVDNFIITDGRGKSSYYKKWKKVPGERMPLTDEDLENRLRGEHYVDLAA